MHRHLLTTLLAAGAALIGGTAHAEGLKACRAADFASPPVDIPQHEADSHRLTAMPVIVYPHGQFAGGFLPGIPVTVDATGKPLCHVPFRRDARFFTPRRMAAIRALDSQRFTPFVRNGQPVVATAMVPIYEEEAVAQFRPIPDARPEDTLVTLERTGCFGGCAAYTVTITGTGRVRYEGNYNALIERNLDYDIPPEAVAQIMAAFEAAQFWSLNDEYIADATDGHTTYVTLKRGDQSRKMTDYLGRGAGLPLAADRLEEDIDRLSGARDLAQGGETVLPRLDALSYDFKGAEAARAMTRMVRHGSLDLITGFLDRGVSPDTALRAAAEDGRYDVFKLAQERGAEIAATDRCDLQVLAADTGDFTMFMAITGENGDVCRKDTILTDLSDMYFYAEADAETGLSCNYTRTWCFRSEPVKILQYLLSHGANMYAVGKYGDMPIDHAYDDASIKAYLAAGYDINHRDAQGNTALMRNDMGAMTMLLLRHGADPFIRNNAGEDFYTRAKFHNDTEALAYIRAHRRQYKNAPQ